LAYNATTTRTSSTFCAIYARYSSDNQRESSIEDPIQNCRETAARKGWVIIEWHIYTDSEKSGTTIDGRDKLARLMTAAEPGYSKIEFR
jgi:DNA invertase Pin-like site-specific DNA recombinase